MSESPYLGLSQDAATAKAEAAGLPWRIVRIDEQRAKVTKDYRPERLNIEIEAGKVVRVTKG